MTNKILYPDYEMHLYVSENIWENPNAKLIRILENTCDLKTRTIKLDYSLTEPAIWRMMPMWDPAVSIFHTRDLDSIPTEIEYRYTRAFEQSDYSVGTLRTHRAHTPNGAGLKCRMLAGLSSFKPPLIPSDLKTNDFSSYYNLRHDQYGSDQDLMISRFAMEPTYTKDNFLDHCAYQQRDPQRFPCGKVTQEMLNSQNVSEEKEELFTFQKRNNLDNWAGEPVDARGSYTFYLLRKPQFGDLLAEMKREFS